MRTTDIVTYILAKRLAKSAISGIKNLTINGLDLIIETNDGNKFVMTFPKPADGLDGVDGTSITNVQIDNNNHLLVDLSDGNQIDAGEIKGIGGGLVQKDKKNNFPLKGKEDALYLSKSTDELFYWDGKAYKPIVSNSNNVYAELKTSDIPFDGVKDTFDLPIDDVNVNIYINGMYMTEGIDYTIDRTINPNTFTLDTIYEDYEVGTITYLKPIKGGDVPGGSDCECPDIIYATKEDIDKLFNNIPIIPPGDDDNGITLATKEDIDKLFK